MLIQPRPGEKGWQRYGAYLWSKKKYKDFILQVEYKYPEGGNSGVFFRVGDLEDPVQKGIEVQILDSTKKKGKVGPHDHGGIIRTVGATKNIIVSSTIGRNKKLIPGNVIKSIIEGTEDVISNLNKFGMNITSSGGETADVGDLVRTIIVDSTIFCRMKRSDVINNQNISSGNVIIGLSSYGKASYEDEYNSGIGSNGLTSARHDVFNKNIKELYPETFDNSLSDDLVYTGSKNIKDKVENSPLNAGKLVLSPTRTYAPILNEVFNNIGRNNINGIIHCSGGAQTKILHFIDNLHIIKDNLFDIPPVFELIQAESSTEWREMYQVFNMGHRMELYVDEKFADEIIKTSKSFDVDAKIIGRVQSSNEKKLTISSKYGTFEY